jgi:hypothetical protein
LATISFFRMTLVSRELGVSAFNVFPFLDGMNTCQG